MIKLIMTDMDGTLLDENGKLPAEFDEVMEMVKERKILFAPASGRQYYALLRQFEKYKDEFIFFAENGTYVAHREIELFSSVMPNATVKNLLRIAKTIPQTYPVVCGKKGAYVTATYEPFIGELEKYYTKFQVVKDFSEIQDEVIKVSFCDFSEQGSEFNTYPHFSEYREQLQISVSSNLWVDVMNYGINKGIAIQQVQKMLGISPKECAAFGDYLNDLEMMSSVYYSFAMDNAHPQIKEVANFAAKSNREHGVMLGIKELLAKGI